MYSLLILMLLAGVVLTVDGMYREEIERLRNNTKVEYKFIPRYMYNDMLYSSPTTPRYQSVFDAKQDARGPGRYE